MEKENKIIDKSGDKKYFTQIPNMIVNHSIAYEQSLYLIMKRLAGEGGHCYASLNFLAKKMGVDKKTVSKTITKLLKRKWVEETDKTKVKGGYVRTFVIIDLWKLNMENYEGGVQVPTSKGGSVEDGSGCQIPESGCQKDTSKNSNNIYNKNGVFNKFLNERRVIPIGDPPDRKPDLAGLKKYRNLKAPLLKKYEFTP